MSENHRKTSAWSLPSEQHRDDVSWVFGYPPAQHQHTHPSRLCMTLDDGSSKDGMVTNNVRREISGRSQQLSRTEPSISAMLPSPAQCPISAIVSNRNNHGIIATERYAVQKVEPTTTPVSNAITFKLGVASTATVGASTRSLTLKERRAMRRDKRRQSAAEQAAHRLSLGANDMKRVRSEAENTAIEKRIRNRESVERCRERKRRRVEKLQCECKELERENAIVKALLSRLESLMSTQKSD